MAQLGGVEAPLELALLAGRPLGVDEEAEAFLEAEGGGLAGLELMVAGVGHRAELHGVELVESLFDRRVQGPEAEERLVAEPGEYPPLGQEYCGLHGGFVPRFPRPRRDDNGAVVGGQILVGPIDARLVAAGTRDGALELVGDPQGRRTPEVLDHAGVGVDPVGQLLGGGRLGVGEAARAEYGDEQLDASQFPGVPVDQCRPLPREVDERLLAGAVDLPHRRPQPSRPLPVDLAELGTAIAVRVDLGVLLPEELKRDAVALELAMDVRAVRLDPVVHRGGTREQPGLDGRVIQLGRQWPAQPSLRRPLQIHRNRAHADPASSGYRPVRQPPLMLETENLTNLPHQ